MKLTPFGQALAYILASIIIAIYGASLFDAPLWARVLIGFAIYFSELTLGFCIGYWLSKTEDNETP